MVRTRTSIKRRTSSRNISRKKHTGSLKHGMGVDAYDPTEALLDEERIGRAIWECLKNGDWEGLIEVIQIHLEAFNKTQLAKEAHLAKTTLYHCFKSKNPTVKTLAKIVQACM